MELEQVWSLRVPEEHENRVRSSEVPPNGLLIQWLECHADNVDAGGSIPPQPTINGLVAQR